MRILSSRHVTSLVIGLSMLLPMKTVVAADPSTQPTRPPNVLFIMADQHNADVLGCAGNPLVKTPNLDRLASEGARITGAVCATPFCTPTRASFRTGLWPHAHGFTFNVAPDPKKERPKRAVRPGKEGLTDSPEILDNVMFDRGYKVEYLGKWHLGNLANLHCFAGKAEQDPDRIAYAKWLATQPASVTSAEAQPGETFVKQLGGVFMTDAILKAGKADALADEEGGDKETQAIGRSAVVPAAQFEAWMADRAMEWIEKHASEPFMLTFSISPPHAPWVVPDPYYSMYDPAKMVLPASYKDRPAAYRAARAAKMGELLGEAGLREQLRCYYGQVTMIDEQIGRLLTKLHELGLDKNTVVIYTSDHGDLQGTHGFAGKSIHGLYDGIARVPLIVRYPGSIRPGQVLDMPSNAVDMMPTILDYANLPIPARVQGHSLRAVLEGKAPVLPGPVFCERGMTGANLGRMIRTPEWKLCVYNGRRELFHLTDDPDEMKNLAGKPRYQETQADLERQLRDWMKKTGDRAEAELFGKAG